MDMSIFDAALARRDEFVSDLLNADPRESERLAKRALTARDRTRRQLDKKGPDPQAYGAEILRAASAPLPRIE